MIVPILINGDKDDLDITHAEMSETEISFILILIMVAWEADVFLVSHSINAQFVQYTQCAQPNLCTLYCILYVYTVYCTA